MLIFVQYSLLLDDFQPNVSLDFIHVDTSKITAVFNKITDLCFKIDVHQKNPLEFHTRCYLWVLGRLFDELKAIAALTIKESQPHQLWSISGQLIPVWTSVRC